MKPTIVFVHAFTEWLFFEFNIYKVVAQTNRATHTDFIWQFFHWQVITQVMPYLNNEDYKMQNH
jgi:hypothetical protein